MSNGPKRTDNRRSYVVKLRPARGNEERDQDLIDWLDSIPDGLRQDVMRAALRLYAGQMLDGQVKADRIAQLLDDSNWLKQALSDMPGWLESKLAALAAAGPMPPPPPQTDSTDQVDAGPRLSDDELARRQQKMKKSAQW